MTLDQFDDFNPDDYAEQGYFNEFTGVFYPARKAGDRYTGPRRGVYLVSAVAHVGDILEIVARFRTSHLNAKRTDDWRAPSLKADYDYLRSIAMRRSFARWCAQRRVADAVAMCSAKAEQLSATVAEIRRAAA